MKKILAQLPNDKYCVICYQSHIKQNFGDTGVSFSQNGITLKSHSYPENSLYYDDETSGQFFVRGNDTSQDFRIVGIPNNTSETLAKMFRYYNLCWE